MAPLRLMAPHSRTPLRTEVKWFVFTLLAWTIASVGGFVWFFATFFGFW